VPWRRYKLNEMEPRKTGTRRDRSERRRGEYRIDRIIRMAPIAPIVLSVSPVQVSLREVLEDRPPSVVM